MGEDNRIGHKIRQLREQLELSVDDVAERSGCDRKMVEQLEAGELAPSLAPLIKISRALGVRLGTLLDDDEVIGPVVTRSGDEDLTTRFRPGTDGERGTLDFFSLAADKASRHMEPFLITVNPAEEHVLSSHEGEEFIHVLDGEIEVAYGRDAYILGAGDSIYYDSIVPHQVRASGVTAARILAVVYAPF